MELITLVHPIYDESPKKACGFSRLENWTKGVRDCPPILVKNDAKELDEYSHAFGETRHTCYENLLFTTITL